MESKGSFLDALLNGYQLLDIWTPPKIIYNEGLEILTYKKRNPNLITFDETVFFIKNIKKIEIETRLFGCDLIVTSIGAKLIVRCLNIKKTKLIVDKIVKKVK